jgi:hypothetical protein
MQLLLGFSTTILVFAFLVLSSPALAITITTTRIENGAILVRGNDAVPNANIIWEGQVVTQVRGNGRFSFQTGILPQDCVGTLSDGVETVNVVIRSCGPQGPPGPPSPSGLSGVEVVSVLDIFVPVGVEVSQVVSCPEGKIALSGGHSVINLSGIRRVTSTNLVVSAPSIDSDTGLPTGWLVTYSANQADDHSLTVYAVCAFVAP